MRTAQIPHIRVSQMVSVPQSVEKYGCARSSIGQSGGLRIRRLGVQLASGACEFYTHLLYDAFVEFSIPHLFWRHVSERAIYEQQMERDF